MIAPLLSLLLLIQPAQAAEVKGQDEQKSPVARAIDGSVDYLLRTQNQSGSFGTGRTKRGYEILATVPGSHQAFRVATTSLAVMALRDALGQRPDAREAVEKSVDWLAEHARVGRPHGLELYNVWSHAYGLRAIVQAYIHEPEGERKERLSAMADRLITALDRYQTLDGGWGYLDFDFKTIKPAGSSMSFTTATALIGLHEAREAGFVVPQRVIDKATTCVRRARMADGAYIYGDYLKYRPAHGVNQIKGSTCRTSTCNLALFLFDQGVDQQDLKDGLQMLFDHQHFSFIARKRPVPHESWYANSGYFYLYGHYYGALVLEHLEPADRQAMGATLRDIILPQQEPDGSFWDYPIYGYGKAYGTAYALSILTRVPEVDGAP